MALRANSSHTANGRSIMQVKLRACPKASRWRALWLAGKHGASGASLMAQLHRCQLCYPEGIIGGEAVINGKGRRQTGPCQYPR
jgi:hypothetical protein